MRQSKNILIIATLLFLGGCNTSQLDEQAGNTIEAEDSRERIEISEKVDTEDGKGGAIKPSPAELEKDETHPMSQALYVTELKSESGKTRMTEGRDLARSKKKESLTGMVRHNAPFRPDITNSVPSTVMNTESYTPVTENTFITTTNDPLSTFSIDVDTASYSNIRRFVTGGSLPPVGAVRIEEMINYFSYSYPQPKAGPFSVSTEVGPSPWVTENKIVKIGLKAKDIDKKDLPASNLVFLIDVSGSMRHPNKLPLLKKSMKLLVSQLDKKDRVSIVVYAGSDRIALQPTSGDRKEEISKAIDSLMSGGSTHGSRGIVTAYRLAEQTLMPRGNNRIILASDGDFNVGVTSRGELTRLIEEKRKSGIYLTVLGFGMGNYHDDTMEVLADKGNGNYAYIDSLLEAKKVMVKEMNGTMFALARDVKIQVEFNPAKVGAYRLIGYENRRLADEDFNDDKKDAGEIGVGHTVTALYELIPAGSKSIPSVDPLKYQRVKSRDEAVSNELLTVKLRYKPLESTTSELLQQVVADREIQLDRTSNDFRFATAVAAYGMLLKESEYVHAFSYPELMKLAKGAKGDDPEGYRAECIRLLEMSELLK